MENVEQNGKGKEENEKCKGNWDRKNKNKNRGLFLTCHFKETIEIFGGYQKWKFLPRKS